MTYLEACKKSICSNWAEFVLERDGIQGNPIELFLYGLKALCVMILKFIVRVVFAVAFPLTAVIVIKNDEHDKRMALKASEDL